MRYFNPAFMRWYEANRERLMPVAAVATAYKAAHGREAVDDYELEAFATSEPAMHKHLDKAGRLFEEGHFDV